MSSQDPRIIELDPESAPRTSALILVLFVVLGVGFVLVNVVFTGDDPYYDYGSWLTDPEPSGSGAFYMIPSLVRDAETRKDEEEATDRFESRGVVKKKPTTGPSSMFPNSKAASVPRKPAEAGDSVVPGAARGADSGNVVVPGAAKASDR